MYIIIIGCNSLVCFYMRVLQHGTFQAVNIVIENTEAISKILILQHNGTDCIVIVLEALPQLITMTRYHEVISVRYSCMIFLLC